MDVDLTKLPLSIRRQIPLSLRSYKDVHVLEELPVTIQYLIRSYFEKALFVKYDKSYDVKPEISGYSDFKSIDSVTDLIAEYLKNYLLTLPESYPWDPYFGCRLKYQIQTRDVNLRQTIISAEVNNIVENVAAEVGAQIDVQNVQLVPISMGTNTEYTATIDIKINNDQSKRISIDYKGAS